MSFSYQYYKNVLTDEKLPIAVLDEDLLLENIEAILKKTEGVKIRIASKSIRSIPVLKRIISVKPQAFSGIMAFTLEEAIFLAENGFNDILLGYPSVQKENLKQIGEKLKKGVQITLMIDLVEHIQAIQKVGEELDVTFPVCVDVDMSVQFPGVYFGVYRSSLNHIDKLPQLLNELKQSSHVEVIGVMGYEAQIAGVGDNAKGKSLMNSVIRYLKIKSIPKIAKRREAFVREIEAFNGKKLQIVNAGGTGSISSSKKEDWVTEITVGSGFYSPGLFDNYKEFHYQPALFYGVELSRHPQKEIWTASGGGYVASGALGNDKIPKPYLPEGINLIKNEAVGEVQTPFTFSGNDKLELGAPVFFRHAKAGELCERFNELVVISEGKIVNQYKTYRGEGKCFL